MSQQEAFEYFNARKGDKLSSKRFEADKNCVFIVYEIPKNYVYMTVVYNEKWNDELLISSRYLKLQDKKPEEITYEIIKAEKEKLYTLLDLWKVKYNDYNPLQYPSSLTT
jgi:hypothetical protein